MLAVTRFDVPQGEAAAFQSDLEAVLTLLAVRPGFVRGRVGRAVDDPTVWVLSTEWHDVGSYRRGIGGYDVKLAATPLFVRSRSEPGAFEVLASSDGAQEPGTVPSGRAR